MSQSLSHLCYLQTLPPISHNTTFNSRQKPPRLPPRRNLNGTERRRRFYTVCGRGNNRASTPNKDDYHATLKALNSKGRSPKKSLGQVRWFLMTHCVVTLQSTFFYLFLGEYFWVLYEAFYRTRGGRVLFCT